jgi:hypothetical protein
MKFIIDNYSANHTSQALYLYNYIKNLGEHGCYLNNGDRYIFDLIDEHKPDVYITSCHALSYDIIRYLESEDHKFKLMINVDSAKQGEVYTIEEALLKKKIDFQMFGNNSGVDKLMTKKVKIFNLLDGADLNIVEEKEHWKQKIDIMFVIEDQIDIMNVKHLADNLNTTFHLVSFLKPTEITTSIIEARRSLYHNYNYVVFAGLEHGLKQSFFEAILFGHKVYFVSKSKSENIDELIKRVFKLDISLDFLNPNRLDNFEELRNAILQKHTGGARSKSLLSQLPNII